AIPAGQADDQDLTGLVAGTYNVVITDANGTTGGCRATNGATITQPAAALSSTKTSVDVLCYGGATGSIDLSPSGGTPSYAYAWTTSDGAIPAGQADDEDLTGLVAGTYNVVITDANGTTGGCRATNVATITQPAAALSSTKTSVDVLCYGGATGSIDLSPSGGTPPYAYAWTTSDGAIPAGQADDQDLTGLVAGTYSVVITDANGTTGGCRAANSATITQPNALDLTLTPTDATCVNGNMSISAVITGTPLSDLEINIDGGAFANVTASPVVFSGLTAGSHTVILRRKSDNTCSVTKSATVNAATNCAHIFPTATTCCNYLGGTPTNFILEKVCITVEGNKIKNAIPGVFFYYGDYTATTGGLTTIIVDQTSTGGLAKFDPQNATNVRLFVDDCQVVSPISVTVGPQGGIGKGNVKIVFTAIANKTYVISVKYDVKSIIGTAAPAAVAYASFGMSINSGSLVGVGKVDAVSGACSDTSGTPSGSCNALTTAIAPLEITTAKTTSNAGFDAYPVPFKDQLTIKYKFDYVSDVKIEVFNAQGVLVLSKTDANGYLNKEITLSFKVNKGQEQVYVVKVTTNRGSTSKKVMSSK
ncbi:T9SS type A sorting domain-containing protein, partial [Flavobacterium sp. LB1P71]|uniref:T9SS type A sorting domain-containing protein n=1 Tax=unclassified Flavobacterium TaxID=196869 RepID=UPI003AAE5F8D